MDNKKGTAVTLASIGGVIAIIVGLITILQFFGIAHFQDFFTTSTTPITTSANPTIPVFNPTTDASTSGDQAPRQIINAFCAAFHRNDINTAYSYLSSAYQHRVSEANLPKILSHLDPAFGGPDLISNCTEFSNNGFYTVTGNTASDVYTFTLHATTGSSSHNVGATVSLITESNTWKIDDISQ